MENFVNFESKKGEKTVLYKEAFAAQTPYSWNPDSAFIHLSMKFVLTFRRQALTDGSQCKDTSPVILGHFLSHPLLFTKIVI